MRFPHRELHGLGDAQNNFEALEGILTAPGWRTPTLLNAWVNDTTPGISGAAFFKDGLGFVRLRGRIITGASGTIAFQLPAGYRPGVKDSYAGGAITGGDHADIDTSGNVTCFRGAAVFGLGGISFLAEG